MVVEPPPTSQTPAAARTGASTMRARKAAASLWARSSERSGSTAARAADDVAEQQNRQLADDVEKARKAAASRPQFLFEGTGLRRRRGGSSGLGLGQFARAVRHRPAASYDARRFGGGQRVRLLTQRPQQPPFEPIWRQQPQRQQEPQVRLEQAQQEQQEQVVDQPGGRRGRLEYCRLGVLR